MFGQPASNMINSISSPAGTTTPFGQPNNSNTAFGSTTTTTVPFGSPTPSTGGFGFGSSANTNTGAPSFGQQTTNQAATGFGGFGTTTNTTTSAFGAAANTPNTAQSPFGSPSPATGGGLFGSTNTGNGNQTQGLFGSTSTNTTSAFGSSTTSTTGGFGGFGSTTTNPGTSLFGSTNNNTNTGGGFFGSSSTPSTGGGLFGSTNPTTNAFGSTTNNNTTTTTGFGGFGSTNTQSSMNAGQQNKGTSYVPYQVTSHSDGNDSISLLAITAMPAYQDKSFEELRLEDYTMGNKGTQGQPGGQSSTGGFGGFGATNTTTNTATTGGFGLFGSPSTNTNTTSVFGAASPAPSTGLFGAPTPAPATGGLFGSAPAPAMGGGLFGSAPAAAPSTGGLFGAAAPAPSTGLFGAPAPAPAAGLFGAPTPAQSTGLFGAPAPAPATGGLFGAPAPAPSTGLFGAPAPATSLFGAPAPAPSTGLFGAPAPAPSTGLFGAPAPAPSTGLFGAPAPAPSTGLFGAPAPAPSTGLFGAPAPAPATGGLFGATAPTPAPSTSLFGLPTTPAPAAAPTTAIGGLFGSPAATTTSLFATTPVSATTTTALTPYAAAVGVAQPPPSSDVLLAQQLAAVEAEKKKLALLEPWRGNTSNGSNVIPSSLSERDAAAFSGESTSGTGMSPSYASSSAALHSFQSPRSITRIRPRGFGSSKLMHNSNNNMLRVDPSRLRSPNGMGGGGTAASSLLSPDTFISSSAKRLVIQPGSLSKPKMTLRLTNGDNNDKNGGGPESNSETLGDIQQLSAASTSEKKLMNADIDNEIVFKGGFTSPTPQKPTKSPAENGKNHKNEALSKNTPQTNGYTYNLYREIVASPVENDCIKSPENTRNGGVNLDEEEVTTKSYLPKFTKSGYKISPSLEKMKTMSEADLAAISNFSVERPGYGGVAWDGAVDVRSIDLDSIVRIRGKEVIVYEDEEANGTKPSIGSKLNRPAVVTLHNIFSKDGKDASTEVKQKFTRKIEKQTIKMGAEFISYDPFEGIWKFRTQHFSRYGFDEDDDEDSDMDDGNHETEQNTNIIIKPLLKKLPLLPGDEIPATPLKGTGRFEIDRMNAVEALGDQGIMMVSDNEDYGEANESVLEAAENAYRSFLRLETSTFVQPTGNEQDTGMIEQLDQGFDSDLNSEPPVNIDIPSAYVIPKCSSPVLKYFKQKNGEGLCSRLAKKHGLKNTSSVGTDLSLRMRRSFRVAWRPDGSFVHPSFLNEDKSSRSFTNGYLKQSRPLFQNATMESHILPMLQTHLKHSRKKENEKNSCPLFELPRGLGASNGSIDSYKLLCSALDDYVEVAKKEYLKYNDYEEDPELYQIGARALSLISVLYGQEKCAFGEGLNNDMLPVDDNIMINTGETAITPHVKGDHRLNTAFDRRYEGLILWFHHASKHDMQEFISIALNQNDPLSAILAALTGGNIEKACELASEYGYLRLSLMISNGISSGHKLDLQRQLWHENGTMKNVSTNLNRIFALISGDLEIEEKLYSNSDNSVKLTFDWRQRLSMKLMCNGVSPGTDVAAMIDEYDTDIASGIAPPPEARFKKSNRTNIELSGKKDYCILYRLLRLRASSGGKDGDEDSSLAHIISPCGHTNSIHDYSLSFHIACILQGLGVCPSFSDQEEARLVESYVAMLINAGLWEWGLYVILCVSQQSESMEASRKRTYIERKAKDFFLRYFMTFQKQADEKENIKIRSFLENEVGIPGNWAEEALATWCAYDGDATGYVAHLIGSQKMEEASIAIERLNLPRSLIMGGKSASHLKEFLHSRKLEGVDSAPSWDSINGCGAVLDLLSISDEMERLLEIDDDKLFEEIDTVNRIAELGNNLRSRIIDYRMKSQKSRVYTYMDYYKFASVTKEERDICFAQAAAKLNTLQMQIQLLQSKILNSDLIQEGRGKMYPALGSQLVYLTYSQNDGNEMISTEGLNSHLNLRGASSSFLTAR